MNQSARPTVADIHAAAARIAGAVRRTPLLESGLGRAEASLWLKAECLQLGGSFKLRGATNAIAQLSDDERRRGVVTHSSGNHAQAVARAARDAGVVATIVMPREAPTVKREATVRLGAEVVAVDDSSQRAAEMERIQATTGAVFVSPFEDPAVIAGQGTIGLEILEELPGVSTVLVPVSGGGLVSGIAIAIKSSRPDVRVVGVEPALAGDLAEGYATGVRVTWDSADTGRTIADGLRVPAVGELNWSIISELVDDVVTVSEAEILAAMRATILTSKVVCEPSGAVSVAGYLAYAERFGAGPAVAIVSGGNVDPDLLVDVLGERPQ
ncbi:MAG: threonine/serine dehydratase [Actinomycetota bacterium]|nr:threonine/serine dehydratase [Actinomycetota bacterium]